MTGRILHVLAFCLIALSSWAKGMAQEAVREETRADFFVASELGGEDGKQRAASLDDLGLAQLSEGETEAESSVDGKEEAKRNVKRVPSFKISRNKCRFICFLSPKALARGVSKHPATQDAGQERTAAVRFLQMAALVC